MRTIISGRVTADHLADAELIAGITPTGFLTNGLWTPPATSLPTEVHPIDPMCGELGERQRNMTLLNYADALVAVGRGFELQVSAARKMGLAVYEVAS